MKADDIRIPEPCNEDWGRMTPKQRGKFCGACQKKVHDLSAMSERDAKNLLASGDDICVSYLSDNTGAVQFRPPQIVPVGRLFRRASATAAAGLSLALAACAPHGEGPSIEDAETQQQVFLKVQPSIPDAEPCDATRPDADEPEDLVRTLGEPMPVEEFVRTKGDYAPPPPEPTKKPAKSKLTRTAGMPAR